VDVGRLDVHLTVPLGHEEADDGRDVCVSRCELRKRLLDGLERISVERDELTDLAFGQHDDRFLSWKRHGA